MGSLSGALASGTNLEGDVFSEGLATELSTGDVGRLEVTDPVDWGTPKECLTVGLKDPAFLNVLN